MKYIKITQRPSGHLFLAVEPYFKLEILLTTILVAGVYLDGLINFNQFVCRALQPKSMHFFTTATSELQMMYSKKTCA